MKNIIALGLALVMGLATLVAAGPMRSLTTPKGSDGANINHPLYGGYQYSYIAQTAEYQVCDGRCLLAGLFRGTGAVTSYLTVRDTSITGNTSTATIAFRVHYDVAETRVLENPIALPIVLQNGITVALSSVSADERVTVVYLDLDVDTAGADPTVSVK